MKKAVIKIDKDYKIGPVDNRIYGNFIFLYDRCL